MKSEKQPPMRQGSPDDFQTPPEALKPLLPFLNKRWVMWECACGKGNLVDELFKKEFEVVATDLETGWKNCEYCKGIGIDPKDTNNEKPCPYCALNFLDSDLGEEVDYCIVTNPPFSLKQEFLQRCYELKKPFALLLPLTTFETAKRQNLFKRYGLQVIFFDKRINFETPSGNGSGSWFATAWFTWGLNLPKDMMFLKLER